MEDHPVFLKPWGEVRVQDWHDWKWQFKNGLATLTPWAGRIDGSATQYRDLLAVTKIYPFRVTPYYLALMDVSNPADPLRRQCFPDLQEIRFSLGGVDDPLEEGRYMPVPGLIHRYADRKRLWENKPSAGMQAYLQPMIAYIRQRKDIREVIVSGGDPLTLNDHALARILESLRAIPHVEVLRIGSRIPVVMPMRVTPALCKMLRKYRPLWFNTQFNHPREITSDAVRACEMLLDAGIPVSNQSVLLHGVNDSHDVMRELLYGLQRISVRPYYLFQCDPVRGTDHFRVDLQRGLDIMQKLQCNMSGLCMPRYVVDLPGGRGKWPLQTSSWMLAEMDDRQVDQHFFDKIC
jgi:lysine 2,3-aminomutase